jgi:hypothetical protein
MPHLIRGACKLFLSSLVAASAALILLPALPASAKNTPLNVKALAGSINRAKHLTYEAQYTSVSGGQTTTVTIAQAPPKSNFSTANASVINDGKSTYYCGSGSSGNSGNSGGTGKTSCISSSGSNPLLGLEDLFSPSLAVTALGQASEGGIVARLLGIKVSYSTATYAGQPSNCVTITRRSTSGKYCVTKQGILSYSGSASGSHFELTSFSSKPSPGLFALPAGATITTFPGGSSVSIP